jgi:hypothetical protein
MKAQRFFEIPMTIYQSIGRHIQIYFKIWLLISFLRGQRPSSFSSEDWRWEVKCLGVLGDDRYLTSGHGYSSTRQCDGWCGANSVTHNSKWKFSPSDHVSRRNIREQGNKLWSVHKRSTLQVRMAARDVWNKVRKHPQNITVLEPHPCHFP